MSRSSYVVKWMQSGMREMDMGEAVVPLAPGFCRARNIS